MTIGQARTSAAASIVAAGTRALDLTVALEWLLGVIALVYIVGFLAATFFRATFTYPLVPREAPSMQAVRRILSGLPLYTAPALDYVPTLYAPLYFYLSALVATVLGPNLTALRLVSVAATLGSSLLIAHLVWRETHSRLAALVAASLFLCSTTLSETILDIARVDPLSLFFLLAGLDAARAADLRASRASVWLSLLSGGLLGLAVLTKQTAIALVVVMTLHAALTQQKWRFAAFVGGVLLVVGIGAALLASQYGSWAAVYLIDLPRQHTLDLHRLETFWSVELLPAFTLPVVALAVFLIGSWLRQNYGALRFWVLAPVGMLGMAWGASLNLWSGSNVVLTAYAILSAGFGLGLAETFERLHGPGNAARVFQRYVLLLGVVQFAFVHYNPRQTSPLRSDVDAGQRFVAKIAGLPGSVYAPEYPELVYQAGKGEDAFGLSIGELQGIFGGKPRAEASQWARAYEQALDERRYDTVLLEVNGVLPLVSDTTHDHGYVDMGPLFPANDEFYRLDSPYLPRLHVWVPRERANR